MLWKNSHEFFSLNTHSVQFSRSVMSNSCDTSLLSSSVGDFPGKSAGVDCHFLLQGIFRPRNRTRVSGMGGRRFTVWVTREVIAKEDVKSKNPQGLLTPNGNRPHSVILTTHSALKL